LVGVSLDRDAAAMKAGVKEKGLDWPQILDTGSKISGAWNVDSIPRTFLLSPEGAILWTGHPGNGLDDAIKKAFKEHPPQLVDPKVVAEATAALDKVSSAVQSKDYTAAMKLLGRVPAGAAKDKDVAAKLADVQKEMSAFADSMLAEVEPLITAKEYPAAVSKLRDLSLKLAGTPSGTKARERLAALAGDPEVRKQIDAAEKAEKADAALTVAQKMQSDKKDAIAYARYKEIVTMFAGTPAATTAAAAIADYEKDPAFVKNVLGAQNEAKAKAALGLADSYKSAGKTDKAKKKYQEVIEQYPGTPQAASAKKALAEIAGG
jgi:tetratricopeptide (TPR) repeat protein